LRCAQDGANVVVAAKTVESTPRTPGTIFDAAREVEEAGGQALPFQLDVRDGERVAAMAEAAVERFGGIDALINNAGAIMLAPVQFTPLKRYDLMMSINVRASFACAQACIPHLKKSDNGHIITLSPPIDMDPRWFGAHAAYTISKYGMTMLTMGLAEELRGDGVAANSLWPATAIATAAVAMLGGDSMLDMSRKVDIMADAAYAILTSDAREHTGNAYIDENILRDRGVTDFDAYAVKPGNPLAPDLFLPGSGF
jgi:citronellol/citronellal dehydrogenase